ncbi:MAG: hypothetical protein ACYC8T_33450 [Myxococcaceae bacterium]
MPRALLLAVSALLSSACLMPRSASFGQTATPLAPGSIELGLTPGMAFQGVNGPPIPSGGTTNVATTRNFGLLGGEGNLALGLTDSLGLNLHLSPAGVQPGLKVALSRSSLSLAVMPEVALGYWSRGASNLRTQGSTRTDTDSGGTNSFGLLLGAKVLASHSSGIYGGAGYAYQQFVSSNTGPNARDRGTVNVSHAFSFAMGWELGRGSVKVRPELALMILPVVGGWNTTGTTSAWAGSGSEFFLFPNVTIALQSPSHSEASPAGGMQPEELSMPPVFSAP